MRILKPGEIIKETDVYNCRWWPNPKDPKMKPVPFYMVGQPVRDDELYKHQQISREEE